MATKTGPVFIIPCHRAQDLAERIDGYAEKDVELIQFAAYLRTFTKGFAQVCVAEEDFILWLGGPDIRDFQLGGRDSKTTLIREDGVFTNDPADLPSRRSSPNSPEVADPSEDEEGE